MTALLVAGVLALSVLGACSYLEGRTGPGDTGEPRGGIEDRRRVGVPGSD